MTSASRERIRVRSFAGMRRAAGEEGGVVARRELLGLAEDLLERRPLPERARAAVMERGGGHGRDAVDPAEDVVVGRREAGDLERGRDEDRAVQPDARALLEHPREPADAVAAVALARDEHGRAPAAVLGEPAAHELAERLEVALVPEVLLRVGSVVRLRALLAVALLLRLDDAAEAGADRVDEHEVGEREPGRLVLDEPRGHRRQRPVRREVDALRADRAHVQVGRRGSRARR